MTAQGIIASCATGPLMVAPPSLTGQGAPASTFKGILGQSYFDTSTSPRTAYVFTGVEWILDGQGSSDVNSVTGTANQITATTTLGDVVLTIPSTFIAPGSIAATTTLTATLGNITATNGNLSLGTAGNKIIIATGANASVGTSAAMTAGAITVATTASSATAKVFYSRATTGGTTGDVSITAQDGTGFTLTSTSNTETSTFNWWIINA